MTENCSKESLMLQWLCENFDISRQEDADFLYIFLHDCTAVGHIPYDAIQYMIKFAAFAGIDLREKCLVVRVLKSEL
jgi:hypothetical protein